MSERTYEPSGRRLAEIRQKGDVPLSADLVSSVTLLVAIYLLGSKLGPLLAVLQDLMRHMLSGLGRQEITVTSLRSGALGLSGTLAGALLPFMAMIAATGIIVTLVQTRGLIATSRLQPDLGRLNPYSGIKRIFSRNGLFETGKGLVKMAVLALILYGVMRDLPAKLTLVSQGDLRAGLDLVGQSMGDIARRAAFFLVGAAGVDYVWQKRQHSQRIKMTREEVTEEHKNAEGSPQIKSKIREMQHRWSRQRMMQQVVKADVVVTNPTHMAIALKYDAKKMAAPTVIAKGKGLIAQEIMKRARDAGIPVIQNIPLAHALINVELDAPIPVALYQAVAEVLAFVYRLRRTRGDVPSQGAAQ